MACMPFAILKIETREYASDGSSQLCSVDLLSETSGLCALDWRPRTAPAKGGGTWRDSPLAEGRRLAMRKRQNALDLQQAW